MIIRNAIRCKKCGDVIESTHEHDYQRCSCGTVGVDGGHVYLRRVGYEDDIEELSDVENEND